MLVFNDFNLSFTSPTGHRWVLLNTAKAYRSNKSAIPWWMESNHLPVAALKPLLTKVLDGVSLAESSTLEACGVEGSAAGWIARIEGSVLHQTGFLEPLIPKKRKKKKTE